MSARTLLIVTGDPGGARVLISGIVVLRRKHPRWKFEVFAGPNSFKLWKDEHFKPKRWAARVMSRKVAETILCSISPDALVTGTSFENPTESHFRKIAQEFNVPSFSALDHWCNYGHRYELNGRLLAPDLLGVMDDFALRKMLSAGIPRQKLVIVGHPVLEPFLKRRHAGKSNSNQILYLSEPISWDGNLNPRVVRHPKHNELTLLRALLAVPELQNFKLCIRPHPLEPLTRLKKIVRKAPKGLKVKIDRRRSLEQEFKRSRVILGITSIALLQALLMGKPVLSLQAKGTSGRIPDDILCFLPRVESNRCFIEAVSKFVRTRRASGKCFALGQRPKLPADSSARIARTIERLIHA